MSLKSSLTRWRSQRQKRARYGASTRQPRFETLEDRCMLSLTHAASYIAGLYPVDLVTADFNKDGTLDLAVANSSYLNNVSVLLGGASGTFGPVVSYPAGDHPQSIAVGDFDDDGNLDLATVSGDYHPDWLPDAQGAVSVMF